MRADLPEVLEEIARFACISDESSAAIAEAALALRALRDAPVGEVIGLDLAAFERPTWTVLDDRKRVAVGGMLDRRVRLVVVEPSA